MTHIPQSVHSLLSFPLVGGTAQKGFSSYPLPETMASIPHTEELQTRAYWKEKSPVTLQETSWRHIIRITVPLITILTGTMADIY